MAVLWRLGSGALTARTVYFSLKETIQIFRSKGLEEFERTGLSSNGPQDDLLSPLGSEVQKQRLSLRAQQAECSEEEGPTPFDPRV